MRITLDEVSLRRGEWQLMASGRFDLGIHQVSGRVGSGKSTLALLMGGLLEPEEGCIRMEGIRRRMLSFQFPEYHVTERSVAGEIASWGCDPDTVIAEAGLGGRGDEDPLLLSRGELKRLHLACILRCDCDLLLLDDPFCSLDWRGRRQVWDWIERRRGIVVVFTNERRVLPGVRWRWEIREGLLRSMDGSHPPAVDPPPFAGERGREERCGIPG
ncbi:MAG: ATP-binding cassette domain-containing protein [Methanomicrobiales archaeon]|nr:ATP-binding cassette domain-containing protein [Methanomicrobiales archaeon]